MPTVTVTEADVGNVLATAGVLSSIKMLTAPTSYTDDYFSLSDPIQNRALFNLHISTAYVSDNSVLMSGGEALFNELVLSAIPAGSSFEITTVTEADITPVLTSLSQTSAVSGDPPFALTCNGSQMTGNTVINFAGTDQQTTFGDPTRVGCLIMPIIYPPGPVQVYLHDGGLESAPLTFTFTEPPETETPPEE